IFSATKKLLEIRGRLPVVADHSNLIWLTPHNVHVAGYLRHKDEQRLFCIFNFNNAAAYLTWYVFKENGHVPEVLVDHWSGKTYEVGQDHEFFVLPPYGFALLEG
ncbi:MAG: alpha-glucosidase C-terminal domain-containing protein, partial [Lacibacter sp.]|nr:alpha-glucosidase C-terminal domain-containing protein [Lacibacter sp.]